MANTINAARNNFFPFYSDTNEMITVSFTNVFWAAIGLFVLMHTEKNDDRGEWFCGHRRMEPNKLQMARTNVHTMDHQESERVFKCRTRLYIAITTRNNPLTLHSRWSDDARVL